MLAFDWHFWARPEQLLPDGRWRFWAPIAGRGWGKTRVGSEAVIEWARQGDRPIIHLIGRAAADVRDVMVRGESGILNCSPPWFWPSYSEQKRRLTWPNGVTALCFSAQEPDQLRGPQCYGAWADEPAAWQYPERAFDMANMGLRLGAAPRMILTTTPRPIPLIKDIVSRTNAVVTRGSTYDNAANLSEDALAEYVYRYEGSRLGRQELLGEILDDNPASIFRRSDIDQGRRPSAPPDIMRIIIGVDPAASDGQDAASTGIVVAGIDSGGHIYVLEDGTIKGSPHKWAMQVAALYHKWGANLVVAEGNNGGEMVRFTLRTMDSTMPIEIVHASRGKRTRAEPVAVLYEQGRVHHIGQFAELEDQMCEWDPDNTKLPSPDRMKLPSPDRMDAMVWALTVLTQKPNRQGYAFG